MDVRSGFTEKESEMKGNGLDPVEIARSYLKKHKNNVVNATNAMTDAVMKDLGLYRVIMDPLVRTACYDYIRGICRKDNQVVWEGKQPSSASESDRIKHLADGMSSAYMLFQLPGGKYLKDATHEDIGDAAKFHLSQSRTMGIKGNWLLLVQAKVPSGGKKKVSDVLTEGELVKLRVKAEKEI